MRTAVAIWKRWRRLDAFDRHATVTAAFVLPCAALGLRVMPLKAILWGVTRRSGAAARSSNVDVAARLTHAVARAAHRGVWSGNCLSRSITLMHLLDRHGLQGNLRLGAATVDGRFAAHAWIEHDGRVLNDRRDVTTRFVPFPAISGGTPEYRDVSQ